MDKLRTGVQAAVTALSNGYYAGFLSGKIYQGQSKQLCLPGLNCYSCPGALGSCPIGALQAVANDKSFSISMYTIGFLMITGALLGRLVCGWLCPFGLFQDLLYKIPFVKKIRVVPGDRYLKPIKYLVLVLFVLILPMVLMNEFGQGDPWFCAYICPSGTLMAGWPLLLVNEGLRSSIGLLFGWKTLLLLGFIVLSLSIYRPFCRWFCPLGAVYGLFNPVSIYRHQHSKEACQSCGNCNMVCKLNLQPYDKPNSVECIRCGDCIKACPAGALSRVPLIVLKKRRKLMDDCLFCLIAEKKIPSNTVYEDDLIYVFHDIDPQAPVHVLMVPKKHIASTETISKEDSPLVAHMMLKIQDISALLGLENGYRVVMNCGEDGLQTVSHLHMHILGKRKLTWPPG